MYVHGESITNILLDRDRIPRKNKQNKLLEILITGNEITQEPDNQSLKTKVNISIDKTKPYIKLTVPLYTNNQD